MGFKISLIGCFDKAIYLVLTLSLNNIFFSDKFRYMYVLKTKWKQIHVLSKVMIIYFFMHLIMTRLLKTTGLQDDIL